MWNDRRDDGFWERWLFVSPDVRPKSDPGDCVEVPRETLREWTEILCVLWERARRVAKQFCDAPELLHCDEGGKAVFDEGLRRHVEQMNHGAFPHGLRGPWTRLGTYAGRFWLILTVLESVVDARGDSEGSPTASIETARGAWRLVEYFSESQPPHRPRPDDPRTAEFRGERGFFQQNSGIRSQSLSPTGFPFR
jgi:hypothetical protein